MPKKPDTDQLLAYLNDMSPEERARMKTVMESMLDSLADAEDLDPTESAALSMETRAREQEATAIEDAARRIADAAVNSARQQAAAVAADLKAQAEEREQENREAADLKRMAAEGSTKPAKEGDEDEEDDKDEEDKDKPKPKPTSTPTTKSSAPSDELIETTVYDLVKASFTNAPWSTPESSLSPEAFCSVCLTDENPAGEEKTKARCHLPIRSTPGGPVNKNALRNASARLNQTNMSSESKAAARAKLARLMTAAGIESQLNKDAEDAVPQPQSADFTIEAEFIKSSTPDRIAIAVAYPNYQPGEYDTQGDRMSEREIELMAHRFMKDSQQYDLHHTILDVAPEDATIVESYIAPVDFTINDKFIRKGSWLVATQFSESLWARVIKGEFNAYSIRGRGIRNKVEQSN